jgi:transcriptional regulator NrdR family protein
MVPVVLRCPHCFHEYLELSLKLKELKESQQQEAMMIRTREKCPDCTVSTTLAEMHYIWKPDTEQHTHY